MNSALNLALDLAPFPSALLTIPPIPISGESVLWLESWDINSLTISDGKISQWQDKSPIANPATQSSSSNQPLRESNSIRFDGNQWMVFGNQRSFTNGLTIGVCYKVNWTGNYSPVFLTKTASNIPAPFDLYGNPPSFYGGGSASTGETIGAWRTRIFTHSKTNTGYYLNGAVDGSSSANWYTENGNLTLGSRDDRVTTMSGNIAALVVYARALNSSEILLLQQYLDAVRNII